MTKQADHQETVRVHIQTQTAEIIDRYLKPDEDRADFIRKAVAIMAKQRREARPPKTVVEKEVKPLTADPLSNEEVDLLDQAIDLVAAGEA